MHDRFAYINAGLCLFPFSLFPFSFLFILFPFSALFVFCFLYHRDVCIIDFMCMINFLKFLFFGDLFVSSLPSSVF